MAAINNICANYNERYREALSALEVGGGISRFSYPLAFFSRFYLLYTSLSFHIANAIVASKTRRVNLLLNMRAEQGPFLKKAIHLYATPTAMSRLSLLVREPAFGCLSGGP